MAKKLLTKTLKTALFSILTALFIFMIIQGTLILLPIEVGLGFIIVGSIGLIITLILLNKNKSKR